VLSPLSIASKGNLIRSPLALYADGYLTFGGLPPDMLPVGAGLSRRKYNKWLSDLAYIKSLKPSKIKRNVKKIAAIAQEINAATPLIYQLSAGNSLNNIKTVDLAREIRLIEDVLESMATREASMRRKKVAILLLLH
jgi:hypothetical protein